MKKSIVMFAAALAFGATALASQAAEITVSAASSLTNAFRAVAAAYQQKYPDGKIDLNFAASGSLLQQMTQGAPVDVFASADQKTMNNAAAHKLLAAGKRVDFAQNTIVAALPIDSKLSAKDMKDLTKPAFRKVAFGNPDIVPAGRYAKRAMEGAGTWKAMQAKLIQGENVRQVLNYVMRDEVDAGFVFGTDAAIMPDKVKVAFTVPLDEKILYPISVTANVKAGSAKAKEADRFVAFVKSEEGQKILAKFGFRKP
jgi:molybdate transport system substrate-binding protein